MKVFIITQDAPMYLAELLDHFLRRLKNTTHEVAGIVVLSPLFNQSIIEEVVSRYRYYGCLDFARLMAFLLRNKLLSLLAFFLPSLGCYSVSNVIHKYGIERIRTGSVNAREFVDRIRRGQIDLIISLASSQIFKKELLAAPRLGCINYHTALLPKYRGRQPLFWAMQNNEKETGISIHEMDEHLDNGPILLQERIEITPQDTLHGLYVKTTASGPDLLIRAVEKMNSHDQQRIPNDPRMASFFGFPTKRDADLFRQRGKKFF